MHTGPPLQIVADGAPDPAYLAIGIAPSNVVGRFDAVSTDACFVTETSMSVQVRLVSRADVDMIALDGELDMVTCPDVLDRLHARATAGRHLVIDLAGVVFFGAAAMTLMQTLHLAATGAGGSCRLVKVPPHIYRVMTLVGFERVVPVGFPSERKLAPHGTSNYCGEGPPV